MSVRRFASFWSSSACLGGLSVHLLLPQIEVHECAETSRTGFQNSGICQDCPLSPFLFILVMALLMYDAQSLLPAAHQKSLRIGELSELLYADDTLLMGARPVESKRTRALSLQLVRLMKCRNAGQLLRPAGAPYTKTSSLHDLGALLTGHGRCESEVSRKFGATRNDFNKL